MVKKINGLIVLGLLYANLVFSQEIIERNFIFPDPSDDREYDFPIDSLNAVSSVDAIYWAGSVYDEVTNRLYSIDMYAQKGIMIDLSTQEVKLFGKGEGRGPEEIVEITVVQVYKDHIALVDIGGKLSHIYSKEKLEYVSTVSDVKLPLFFQIIDNKIISANPLYDLFFREFDLNGKLITKYGSIEGLSKGILNFSGFLSSYKSNEFYLTYYPAYLEYRDMDEVLKLHILPSTKDYQTQQLVEPDFNANSNIAPKDRRFSLLYQDNIIKVISHNESEDGVTVKSNLDIFDSKNLYLCSIDRIELVWAFYYGAEERGQSLIERSLKFRTPYAFAIEKPGFKIRIINLVDVIKRHNNKGK